MKKNHRRNTVLELKDENQVVVAKIFRENRTDVIESNDFKYVVKKSLKNAYVFYNSVNEDTVAVLSRNRIQLKNEAEYSIRTGRSGLIIKEDKEILLKGLYNPDLRHYQIEIHTPIYRDNLINLLAAYYAIRRCKEISQNTTNQIWLMAVQEIDCRQTTTGSSHNLQVGKRLEDRFHGFLHDARRRNENGRYAVMLVHTDWSQSAMANGTAIEQAES